MLIINKWLTTMGSQQKGGGAWNIDRREGNGTCTFCLECNPVSLLIGNQDVGKLAQIACFDIYPGQKIVHKAVLPV